MIQGRSKDSWWFTFARRAFLAVAVSGFISTLWSQPTPDYGEALNAPEFAWKSGGFDSLDPEGVRMWFVDRGDSTVAHDGVSSAISYAINRDSETWIETTVPGPGTVSFWWRVNTDTNHIFLEFSIAGIVQTSITGFTDWTQASFAFGGGDQTLRWRYVSDSQATSSEDYLAWVDEVTIQLQGAPYISVQEQTISAFPGSNYVFAAGTLLGAQPIHTRWFRDDTLLAVETNKLHVNNFARSDTGRYSLVASNSFGVSTATVAIVNYFPDAIEDPPLLWGWRSSGDAPWIIATNDSHDGVDAARSGEMPAGDRESGRLSRLEAFCTGPGWLTFWWRAEFGFVDGSLWFGLDDQYQGDLYATGPWIEQTFPIPDGQHKVTWELGFGFSPVGHTGYGWLDDVRFVPDTTRPRLQITRGPGTATISWPTNYEGYRLETLERFGEGEWMNVPLTGINSATVPTTNAQSFFRLYSASPPIIRP